MPYLFTLPGLLCGLALSIEDVRHRRVPIAWVAAGALLQLAADFAYGVVVNDLFVLLQALLFTVLCCLIQFALALLVPRSLGFGDDTYGIVCRTVWPVACGGLVAGDGRCRHHMDCLVDAIRPTTHITGTCGQGAVCAGDIGGRDCGGGCWGLIPYYSPQSALRTAPLGEGSNEVTTGFRLATCVVRPRSGHVHRRLRRTWFRRCPD